MKLEDRFNLLRDGWVAMEELSALDTERHLFSEDACHACRSAAAAMMRGVSAGDAERMRCTLARDLLVRIDKARYAVLDVEF